MIPHTQHRMKLGALVGLTFSIIVTGTYFYHKVEHFDYIDAFYFSIITLTTVGYGDLHPVTDTGKIFTVFYILIGIGILVAFIDALSQRMVDKKMGRMENREKKRSQKNKPTTKKEAKMKEYYEHVQDQRSSIDKDKTN